jgi:phage major head subunit gpT-like protein
MRTGSTEQLFTRSRSVVSRVVAGETLIVPVRGKVGDLASIYSFNGTGSLIWQLLDAPRSLADLIDAVEHEYEVGQEQAQKDVTQFLNDMLSVGLVDVRASVAVAEGDMVESGMTALEMTATESNRQAVLETAGSQ